LEFDGQDESCAEMERRRVFDCLPDKDEMISSPDTSGDAQSIYVH